MKKNATEILNEAETKKERVRAHVRDAANWFHEREGEMYERADVKDLIADELDVGDEIAHDVVSELVGDGVDPIVQASADGTKYVGVAEFEEFEGAYGYLDHHDAHGHRRRVICAQCVHNSTYDTQVTHATAGDPDGSYGPNADYNDLLEGIHDHYDSQHDELPQTVETGASLVSGTTIGGNTAWHAGNDGGGSGLNADSVDGSHASDLELPSGAINIWSGAVADIPSGWVLCDGNNGTPNLQDKFVVGAGNTYAVDGTGGVDTHTLTTSEMPSHAHKTKGENDTGDFSNPTIGGNLVDDTAGNNNTSAGGDSAHENRPPYHALAYIMKV